MAQQCQGMISLCRCGVTWWCLVNGNHWFSSHTVFPQPASILLWKRKTSSTLVPVYIIEAPGVGVWDWLRPGPSLSAMSSHHLSSSSRQEPWNVPGSHSGLHLAGKSPVDPESPTEGHCVSAALIGSFLKLSRGQGSLILQLAST
jgi:hypothetical protein